MNTFGLVLLMGGKSSRMGTDKAYLKYKEVPFWKRIADEMNQCGPTYLSIDCEERIPNTEYKILLDEYDSIGPIGGIYSSLCKAEESLLFFAPCDIPTLTAEVILEVLKHYEEGFDGVIVSSENGKCYPTIGIYSKKLLPKIQKQIERFDYRLMNLVKDGTFKIVSEKELPISDTGLLNINTPQEYSAIVSLK